MLEVQKERSGDLIPDTAENGSGIQCFVLFLKERKYLNWETWSSRCFLLSGPTFVKLWNQVSLEICQDTGPSPLCDANPRLCDTDMYLQDHNPDSGAELEHSAWHKTPPWDILALSFLHVTTHPCIQSTSQPISYIMCLTHAMLCVNCWGVLRRNCSCLQRAYRPVRMIDTSTVNYKTKYSELTI